MKYSDAFNAGAPTLSRHALDATSRQSTSALLVRFGTYIIKLSDPARFQQILYSQKRRSVCDFIIHEKQALYLAGQATRVSVTEQCLPTPISSAQVERLLISMGLSVTVAKQLAEWSIGYDYFSGMPLGYYDPQASTYVYDYSLITRVGNNVTGALSRLHDTLLTINKAGLFHNDVAPQNILLADKRNGVCECRIIDFGASYIDYDTSWEQPSVSFIEQWYAQRLGRPGLALRTHVIRLRDANISKDLSDWELHRNAIMTTLSGQNPRRLP